MTTFCIRLLKKYLQSSSTIVTVRSQNGSVITLSGSEDVLIVRVNDSLPSNMLLSFIILRSNEALVSPAGIVTLYGPET